MIVLSSAFSQAIVGIDIKGKKDFSVIPASAKQSESILSEIDNLLSKNGFTLQDNDEYGVVVGPGSFTGLRVGTAIVKGLCAGSANKCKVVALSSLGLLAYEYIKENKPKEDFVCIINALSGLYFVCQFDRNGKSVSQERLIDRAELDSIDLIKVGLSGEGICEKEVTLTGEGLLAEAARLLKEGGTVDVKTFAPVYIRKSQAEDALEEKLKKEVIKKS